MASTTTAELADHLSDEPLTPEELFEFQKHLWAVLDRRVRLYTGGESTSVPELTAQRLLASTCFVLEIDTQDLDPVLIRETLRANLDEYFDQKLNELNERASTIPNLWQQACLSTPLLESIALKDTLTSLRDFNSSYNYRYFAHEIPSDIDYPLALPVPETYDGANYVIEYLRRLGIENTFLQCFDLDRCSKVLTNIHPSYRELIINLYEPIAENALQLAVIEQDIFQLNANATTRKTIQESFRCCSKSEVLQYMKNAASKVCAQLGLEDEAAKSYLEKTALNMIPRLLA